MSSRFILHGTEEKTMERLTRSSPLSNMALNATVGRGRPPAR